MLFRLFIDVLKRRIDFALEPDDQMVGVEEGATLLDIRVNRLIPRDFVFRCRVINCR